MGRLREVPAGGARQLSGRHNPLDVEKQMETKVKRKEKIKLKKLKELH